MDLLNQELGFSRIKLMEEESKYNFVLEQTKKYPDDEYLKSMLDFTLRSYESAKKILNELEAEYLEYLEESLEYD